MMRKGVVKKFAPKVRSGCINCKRRRVKCDERHPRCYRCAKHGIDCEGYQIPRTWLFQGRLPQEAESSFSTFSISISSSDSRANPYDESSDIVPHRDGSERLHHRVRHTILSHPMNAGPTNERSLQFWLQVTAPNLATYGPVGTMWENLVPSLAQNYDSIRHLILATAMVDESVAFKGESPICAELLPSAFSHYQAAVSDMVVTRLPKDIVVIASLIAWVFETMLGNFRCASMHIEAASNLVREINRRPSDFDRSTQHLVESEIKPCLRLSVGYSRAMFDNEMPEQSRELGLDELMGNEPQQLSVASLQEAQELIEARVKLFCSKPHTPQGVRAFHAWLTTWQNALLVHRSGGSGSTFHKRSAHLFANLVMAPLPVWLMNLSMAHEVGAYDITANPSTVDHILSEVSLIAGSLSQYSPRDLEIVKEVLQSLLLHIICHLPGTAESEQAEELLQRLQNSCEYGEWRVHQT